MHTVLMNLRHIDTYQHTILNQRWKHLFKVRYFFTRSKRLQNSCDASENDNPSSNIINHDVDKAVGKLPCDQSLRLSLQCDQPERAQLLRVAVIGTPNSGKSTLINQLMKWKVFAVSSKVHTTRRNTLGVYTQDSTQLVFLDTPGIIPLQSARRVKLEKSMLLDPHASLAHADLVGVLVDVQNRWTRNELDREILKVLHLNPNTPSILILNKVDVLRDKIALLSATRNLTDGHVRDSAFHSTKTSRHETKISAKQLLEKLEGPAEIDEDVERTTGTNAEHATLRPVIYREWLDNQIAGKARKANTSEGTDVDLRKQIRYLNRAVSGKKGWGRFQEVFMVSALTGDGIEGLRNYLLEQAVPCDWLYHSSLVTDQSPTELAKSFVWEKFMDRLPDEVPYNLKLEIVLWEVDQDSGLMKIIMDVVCHSKRYYRLVLGQNGSTITAVAGDAKQELLNAFRTDILFKLQAKLVEIDK